MIYLIGGPPRCGKTTLARRLATETNCSWFPVDYLSTAVSNYIAPAELPTRYPQLPRNNDTRFTAFSAAEIVGVYRTKAATTWPALRDFIAYAHADYEHDAGRDFAFEGYQVEPSYVHALDAELGPAAVRAVFLYREDAAAIVADLRHGSGPHDWVLNHTHEPATFGRIAAMIAHYSAFFREEAAACGFAAINLDDGFASGLDRALSLLLATP